MKIKKDKLYKNIPEVPLTKGDVRIMFDDGKGMVCMDFESPGKLNTFLKDFVYKGFEQMSNKCKSCGKLIIWLNTSHGKKIPVDYHPDIDPKIMVFDPKTMVSHFATCPNAAKHRKAR